MPLETRRQPILGQVALALAVLSAVTTPLTLGAVHASVLAVHAAFAHLALLLHVVERWKAGRPVRVSWLGLPIALGLVLHLLYLVPLPEAVRMVLSPVGTDRVLFVTAGLPPEARELVRPVLSLDPPWTAYSALRLTAALCVFVVVAGRCHRREAKRLAYWIILGATAALLLVSYGHRLFVIPKIYGVWGTGKTLAPLYAPLINPNHLGRALGVCGLLCLGRALELRTRNERLWFAAVGLVGCGSVALTASNGAVLAMLVAAPMLVLYGLQQREQRYGQRTDAPRLSRRVLVLVGLAASVVCGAIVLIAGHALSSTEDTPLWQRSKLALYAPSLRLLDDFWRTGVSPGGYQSAVPSVLAPGELWGNVTISHVENTVIQMLVDYGVLFSALLFGACLIVGLRFILSARERPQLTALFALLFLVIGDLLDFSLELGFGACLGALALGLSASAVNGTHALSTRAPVALVVAGVLAIASASFAAVAIPDERRVSDARLRTLAGDERLRAAERAMARHPSDPHYAYHLTVAARGRREMKEALAWANRTLNLRPAHPGAHQEAARALWAAGFRDQALLEYRLAYASGQPDVVEEIAGRTQKVAEIARALPDNDVRGLSVACDELSRRRSPSELACRDLAAERAPRDADLRAAAINAALKIGDVPGAVARAEKASQELRVDGELAASVVAAEAARTDLPTAFEQSTALLPGLRSPEPLLTWRVEAGRRLKRYAEAQESLKRLRSAPRRKLELGRRELDLLEARLHEKAGDLPNAFRIYARVSDRRPRDAGAALSAARVAMMLNADRDARRYARRAVRVSGGKAGADLLRRLEGDTEKAP